MTELRLFRLTVAGVIKALQAHDMFIESAASLKAVAVSPLKTEGEKIVKDFILNITYSDVVTVKQQNLCTSQEV